MSVGTLNGVPNNFRTYKVLVAGEFSGRKVDLAKDFSIGTSNKSDKYLSKFPLGKVPTLETRNGETLFESNAIAYYLANDQLKGSTDIEKAQVLQWLMFSDNELLPAVAQWVYPILGIIPSNPAATAAKADLSKLLSLLNKHLLSRTFLVSERVTLADVVLACSLLPAYQVVLDESNRKPYVNVNRWFNTCVNQPQFRRVLGDVKLCEKEGVSTISVKAPEPTPEPKKSSKKSAKDAEDDDGGDEMAEFQDKPAKDPFDAFPKGTWNMDDFKRFYSNNPEVQAIDYFWSKFDKEHYSIWYGEYKYPEDLSLVFMSCNLMSGMIQRLEKMRKNAFGSLVLFGEDGKSEIGQLWIWRGQELAFELSDDWKVDYESYDWRKIDPDTDEAKKLVADYFTWDGDFQLKGKKFNQGKIFK